MAVSLERAEAVETADGHHKFFYPQFSGLTPDDPEFPNAIRPETIDQIIKLRHTHSKVRDISLGELTVAEVDAIYHPWIPLTAEEATHLIEGQQNLAEHPIKATLTDPSLFPISPFGRWLPPLASRLGL